MELPVSFQSMQFASAVLSGVALALIYDIFRSLRRRIPSLTVFLDCLFGLLCTAGFLLLGLYSGQGIFRLFMFGGIFSGVLVYFLTASPLVLRLMDAVWQMLSTVFSFLFRLFRKITTPLVFFLEKIKIFSKKIFSFLLKWYTMKIKKKRLFRGNNTGGAQHEIQKNLDSHQTGDSHPGGVRYVYAGDDATSDFPKRGRSRRSDRRRVRHGK